MSTKQLIADARARLTARRIGSSIMRETDKDLVVIRKLAEALQAWVPNEDELAIARNIVNQIGDVYAEHIPSPEWVPVRQQTNDKLDAFAALLIRTLRTPEPSDEHLSNVTINGVRQTWQQLYELEHAQHVALQGYRRMLADLDRNATGRHQGDHDTFVPGGISEGNPHLTTGVVIGYDIGGRAYVVPEPRDRGTLAAWMPAAKEGAEQ
jgi:hypothetical protein